MWFCGSFEIPQKLVNKPQDFRSKKNRTLL